MNRFVIDAVNVGCALATDLTVRCRGVQLDSRSGSGCARLAGPLPRQIHQRVIDAAS
jgi:hypothetical protein